MKFREAPSGQQSPPSWSFPGMTLNGFALEATLTALEDWCEQTLNQASDSNFVPALPVVYLCVAQYPKMIVDAYANLGFSVQNEYFFMFPVIRMWNGVVRAEVGWAYPFIGVDNATSVVSGQMVLGLPKVYGEFNFPATPTANAFAADVHMLALLTHTKATQQDIEPLLKVNATNAAPGPAAMDFPTGLLMHPAVQAMLPSSLSPLIAQAVDAGNMITGAGFGLRQLRDCAAPADAAFTDIVRMRWNATNEQNIQLWQNAQIDLFDNATFPISDTLGLVGGQAQPAPPGGIRYTALGGFVMTLDLSVSASSLPPVS